MPAKTDRILASLPPTFRALPRPTALFSVADAFGNELLQAENTLAAIMLAHWVDHADKGAVSIDDLARIASLYGLAPRGGQAADPCVPVDEESVEEFRAHLKRHVRTFLEGTTTVQGVFRVVAEALGLSIADAYADIDSWWTRADDSLVTAEPRGVDAAPLLFGVEGARATGSDATPARVRGEPDLAAGADLRDGSILRLALDGSPATDIDHASHVHRLDAATLDEVTIAINLALGREVASHDGHRLSLTAPTVGAASRLEVQDVSNDAAPRLLGLPPRLYRGSAEAPAAVTGMVDLSGGVDLSDDRYLRLLVDGRLLAEIDCAGANAANTALPEIVAVINSELGAPVARADGPHLALQSPTTGVASSLAILRPAAQEATTRLLGPVQSIYLGRDARAAIVVGTRDLSSGVDLSAGSLVRVRIDAAQPVTVDCTGADPTQTGLDELTAALNRGLGPAVASHDGRFVRLRSPTVGPDARIEFESPPDRDGTESIFGILPRTFSGAEPAPARLVGLVDLSAGIVLGGRRAVKIGVDGAAPREVRLAEGGAAAAGPLTLDQLRGELNAALGAPIASHDGRHLVLTSTSTGPSGRVAIEPLETIRRRRFVSRAFVTDEAAQSIFGFVRAHARGQPGVGALIKGSADLSHGADLRQGRFLRVSVDGKPFQGIDCAANSPRPRAATLDELVLAMNAVLGEGVASHDGQHLAIRSPTIGAGSRVGIETRGGDALDILLGLDPGPVFGTPPSGVRLVGTVDVSGGLDLSVVHHVSVAVDGAQPVEIDCAGADPAHTSPFEVAIAINLALGGAPVASFDGTHLVLTSPSAGPASRIDLLAPAGADGTQAILGIRTPRHYHGKGPGKARATGVTDLSGPIDLRAARFLRLAVDERPPADVDCASKSGDPGRATLAEVVEAINSALQTAVASTEAGHLVLSSIANGPAARVELLPSSLADARAVLLGDVPDQARGADPSPATIVGNAVLLAPVDLSERGVLRLAIDGGRTLDVDVGGEVPGRSSLPEIVARLDAVVPGLASATPDDHIALTSPTVGEESQLELLPLRALDAIEYPPVTVKDEIGPVRHGGGWQVEHDGAADAMLSIELEAPQGAAGPELVNLSSGRRLRVLEALSPGERLLLLNDPKSGPRATIVDQDGTPREVPPSRIRTGPIGSQTLVPFEGERRLVGARPAEPHSLQLNNPTAAALDVLYARSPRPAGVPVRVTVSASGAGPGFFDVVLRSAAAAGGELEESYLGVSIGLGDESAELVRQITTRPSSLVRAAAVLKSTSLLLERGRSQWAYLDCDGPRFDRARFDDARLPGGVCRERAVFDVSRFAAEPPSPDMEEVVFADAAAPADPPVTVRFHRLRHQPGSLVVNLPADLPDHFGGRFDSTYFAAAATAAEEHPGVFFEPHADFVNLINGSSKLVTAAAIDVLPIGREAVTVPFQRPRTRLLSGGRGSEPATVFLAEPDVPGFIQLTARQPGGWGNAVALTIRPAGPAQFDISICFQGARFENARSLALGAPVQALTTALLQPGLAGVLQARGAGIRAQVTRDRAELNQPEEEI